MDPKMLYEEVDGLRREYGELCERVADATATQRELEAELAALDESLEPLKAELRQAWAEKAAAEVRLDHAEAVSALPSTAAVDREVEELTARLEQARLEATQREQQLARDLRELGEHAGRVRQDLSQAGERSLKQLSNQRENMQKLMEADARRREALEATVASVREQIRNSTRQHQIADVKLDMHAQELQERQEQLNLAKQRQRSALADLAQQHKEYEPQRVQLPSPVSDWLQGELQRISRELQMEQATEAELDEVRKEMEASLERESRG